MSTAVARSRTDSEARPRPDEPRFVFHDVSWPEYEAFLKWVGDHRRVRVTYDRGTMEVISPSPIHEAIKHLLCNIVEILVDETEQPSWTLGSMTMRREDLDCGLEPDVCFYIANAARVLDKREFDFRVDPPPDLVIEVDVTSSSIDRLRLYASLGVAEVWRYDFDAHRLQFLMLNRAGKYVPRPASLSIPGFDATDLVDWLDRSIGKDRTAWRKAFRAWVRRRLAQARKRGRNQNGS
jgi:Uma2 family endonuclease